MLSRYLAAAVFLASVPSMALADPSDPVDPPLDPPGAIGRVAVISGTVSYRVDAATPWQAAVRNTPLTTGNALATDPQSHAALDVGAARLYLDAATEIEIGVLEEGIGALALKAGAVILRVLPGGEGQVFAIRTPRGTARMDQPGYYQIIAGDADAPTRVAALEGGAQFQSPAGERAIGPGERATATDPSVKPSIDPAVEDAFIQRVAEEVEASGENELAAPKHVSVKATGFQDLERHGLWAQTEEYGFVWEPQVMSDWAPYRQGHWVEIAPWGQTWIDDAPWGFTPFHYGRWVQVRSRWAWVPGDASRAPVYAPAVVGFFGTRDKGEEKVGWVALGPEEPYLPPYPVTINYVRVINRPSVPKIVNVTKVTNVTNVTNVVEVVEEHPVFLVGRLKNYRAANSMPGHVSYKSGGLKISLGDAGKPRRRPPAGGTAAPAPTTKLTPSAPPIRAIGPGGI